MGESCNAPVLVVLFNRVVLLFSSFILFYCRFYFGNYIIFIDVYVLPRFESVCVIFGNRGILGIRENISLKSILFS